MSCQGCDVTIQDYASDNLYSWCTNCGNYGIAAAEKRALTELGVEPRNAALFFDIGCNGNGADKIQGYRYHGLHGRCIPAAAGASIANDNLTIVAHGGDGATFSEGVNHLIHAIRHNYNFTFILHNNSAYALTKGQASSLTRPDTPMDLSPDGSSGDTIHALELVFALNPTFVARSFSGNIKQMTQVIKAGIQHKGFSFIEILQACPTYNKTTPHEWYMDRTYDVAEIEGYDNAHLHQARWMARDLDERIATGVLYQKAAPTYLDRQANRRDKKTQLTEEVYAWDVSFLIDKYR
jgi:2-oxoglutarate ferredoxin oxidoreductase subunit beta